MAKVGEARLIQIFSDIRKRGLTDGMFRTLIQSLWRNVSVPETITGDTENVLGTNYHTHKMELPEPQIITIVKTVISDNHESFLIENTANASETVLSSWTVIPYKEQTGEFKAVVMVRNKITDTIITLISLLSFDYSEAPGVILQTDLVTDASLSLEVGVDVNNVLYATVSGMPTDNKRIHLCFERCVLSERASVLQAEGTLELILDAEITGAGMLEADGTLELNIDATIDAIATLEASGELSLEGEAEPSGDAYLEADGTLELTGEAEAQADFSFLYNLDAVNDVRGLAPEGWRVMNLADWTDLITYYGGTNEAGGDLKALELWTAPNTGAANTDGFTAMPAGQRNELGEYSGKLTKAIFWIK